MRARRVDGAWLLVGLVAVSARLLVAAVFPVVPYSGDSWCLVDFGWAPLCASHAPAIAGLWRVLTLGSMTESHVLALQAVLGVVSTLLLFAIARRVLRRGIAVAVTLVFSLMPVELFLERSVMTEVTATLLFVAATLLGVLALGARRAASAMVLVAAGSGLLGLASAVHASVGLAALGLAVVMLVLVAQRQLSGGARRLVVLGLAAVTIVGLVLPAVPTALRFERVFGTATTQAMGGTYLAARWAPLLDCPAPAGSPTPVADFYAVACRQHGFGDPPGIATKLMWDPSLSFLRSPPPADQRAEFARSQATLRKAAISGILHHPIRFSGQMAESLLYELFRPATTQALHVDADAAGELRLAQATSPAAVRSVEAWLGGKTPSGKPTSPDLRRLVSATNQATQVLLWLAMAGGAARFILALRRSRRRQRRLLGAGWWREPPAERVVVGLASVVVVTGTLVSWSLGTWPIFRMWEPMLPFVVLLLGLCWPAGDRRRAEVELG